MSSDPTFTDAARDFRSGGWVVSLLGAAGAILNLLLSRHSFPASVWVKRSLAGVFAGIICYFSLHSAPINGLLKSVIMCTAGSLTPELLERARQLISTKYNNGKNQKTEDKKTKGKVRRGNRAP